MSDYSVFTSESVSEGHPDKMADQVSDAVLDAMLEQDPDSRVACETLVKNSLIVVAGEIRSKADVNFDQLVRRVVREIGYTGYELGIDPDDCTVINALGQQSPDIAMGVDESSEHEQGAGDQGLMFGYATSETDVSQSPVIENGIVTIPLRTYLRSPVARASSANPCMIQWSPSWGLPNAAVQGARSSWRSPILRAAASRCSPPIRL